MIALNKALIMLVSMSRFRISIIPFLLVLIGGSVVRPSPSGRSYLTVALMVLGCLILAALWAINYSEVVTVVKTSWLNLDCRTP